MVRFHPRPPNFPRRLLKVPSTEKWCGCGGSSKSNSVERHAGGMKQLLKALLLIEGGLHPAGARPSVNPLCERQDALYVDFFELGGVSVDLREHESQRTKPLSGKSG